MKKDRAPTRFVELPVDHDAAGVAPLIRGVIEEPSGDTPRLKWRIRNTLHRRTERRARLLRGALVGAVMFAAGGVVGAAVRPFFRGKVSAPRAEDAPTLTERRSPRRAHPAVVSPEARVPEAETQEGKAAIPGQASTPPLTMESDDQATTPTEAQAARAKRLVADAPIRIAPAQKHLAELSPHLTARQAAPSPQLERRPEPAPLSPAPVAPPAVLPAPAAAPAAAPEAGEQALISTALARLRVSREPSAALELLDEYQARYPKGVLAPEAARLRTEALLRSGRKAAVLDDLERTLQGASASDERFVLRGELRAAAGRWSGALADFSAFLGARVIATDGDASDRRVRERAERALWGRSSARSHLGNHEGARADLRDYLRLFPRGQFADRAKQLLDGER
jgi:hypothetical protein